MNSFCSARLRSQRVSAGCLRACTAMEPSKWFCFSKGCKSRGKKSRCNTSIWSLIHSYSMGLYFQKCWWASSRIMMPMIVAGGRRVEPTERKFATRSDLLRRAGCSRGAQVYCSYASSALLAFPGCPCGIPFLSSLLPSRSSPRLRSTSISIRRTFRRRRLRRTGLLL